MNNKLDMKTASVAQGNIEKIRQLLPDGGTEVDKDGKTELAIDFDVLKQELSESLIDEGKERYQMTWPGKRQAVVLANTSTTDTLRPCKEESVDFDNTQNLYIEGDNLNVLKLLRETYLGKIKMIYIDPPYNTGKDFIYKDNFTQNFADYIADSGQYDNLGNRLVQNTESNGRFHSDWLNMIYPRLRIARDLLTDDGVIFISIDDSENENIRKICNEIFGESNFIAQFTRKGSGGRQDSKYFAIVHEYLLCYAKNGDNFVSGKISVENEDYPFFDEEKGLKYKLQLLRKWGENSKRENRPNLFYPITDPDGNEHYPMISDTEDGCWRWSKEKMREEIKNGRVEFKKRDNKWVAYEKIFEVIDGDKTKLYTTIIDDISNNTGASLLKDLFGSKIFNYPKPVDYLTRIIKLANASSDSIILDFFSGSATTAHAVMQLNAEDGGKRKFIMVQLPEKCDEKSEAYKAGYKNICEIGKERIRRAGTKIVEEQAHLLSAVKSGAFEKGKPFAQFTNSESAKAAQAEIRKTLDIGFRVLKLDSSNMQDVYYNPAAVSQTLLDATIDNIKPDRTPLDLLFQVMLELGVPLSAKIEENAVNGKIYYAVNGNDIIACFDDNIDEEVITAIAKQQSLYAVFKDQSFASDSVAINNEQLFKTYSPATEIKVI